MSASHNVRRRHASLLVVGSQAFAMLAIAAACAREDPADRQASEVPAGQAAAQPLVSSAPVVEPAPPEADGAEELEEAKEPEEDDPVNGCMPAPIDRRIVVTLPKTYDVEALAAWWITVRCGRVITSRSLLDKSGEWPESSEGCDWSDADCGLRIEVRDTFEHLQARLRPLGLRAELTGETLRIFEEGADEASRDPVGTDRYELDAGPTMRLD